MTLEWDALKHRWNIMAAEVGLRRCVKFSVRRQRAYKNRVKEHGEDFFHRVLVECRRLRPFAMGEGNRSWKVDLDYVLTPTGAEKLLEGCWRAGGEYKQEQRDQSPRSFEDLLS